jgi:TonB family protein
MNHYFTWLIESGISLAIFYLAYRFFLNRQNLFQSNRSYLLFALLLSTVLPFLKIPSPVNLHYSHYLAEVVVTTNAMPISTEAANQVSTLHILLYIYLFGVVIMMGTFLYRLSQLVRIIRNSQIERKGKIRLAKTKLNHAPFSFLHMIVYNEENLSREEKDKIMEHEAVHVKQLHTLDILLVEIIAILQWFNPFVWLYKTSLKELHEYLADREVIRKGTNIPVYQQLLLNFQLRRQYITLANNFNYSLTKKRFIMMTKTRKNPLASARFLLILPALIAIISLTKLNAAGNLNTQSPPPEEIFIAVEQMPKFNEADDKGLEFRKYIAENLVYPKEAAKSGIQGRVFVQFIVDSEGFVKDVKVIRGVHELLDAEALKIVESSPKWIPGTQRGKAVNVQFTFPISFTLEEGKKE